MMDQLKYSILFTIFINSVLLDKLVKSNLKSGSFYSWNVLMFLLE